MKLETGLRLHVLGTPIFEFNQEPLTADMISTKGQALLVYLALTGRPHQRTTLAGLLWGDMPEESARANLRLTLSKLRKWLGDEHLYATRLEVGLNQYWLDLHEFEQNAAANLQTVCQLYRADFLTGFEVPHAAEFETWTLAVREQVRQTAVRALYDHIETAVQTQQAALGIQAARKLLTIEPWHEAAHRQLMRLLAADGQRTAALTQYETCRRLLADELDIAPAAETTALYEAIITDELPRWHTATFATSPTPLVSTPPPPHNLPIQFAPFIGRAAALERLQQRLQDSRYRLMTLLGEGGVGKTRLSLAAAEQLLPHFPDGVWFVPLTGLETAATNDHLETENRVVSAIAVALGLTFVSGHPPSQQLANHLRHKQLLLILDNFEPLLDTAGLLTTLLSTAPHIKLLATSREPLQLQAEIIFRLNGLDLPTSEEWAVASATDSVQLFAERSERATGQNLLTADNLPRIVQLCRFVNGSPLAIELIASWARWLSLDAIWAELENNVLRLETTLRDVPERHRSLQAVFTTSWQLLTPDEQQLLAQLAVFRGGFQLDGVKAVTGTRPTTLFALLNKSLVQHHTADYYNLHELLRVFAQNQLDHLPIDQDALRDRHAKHYLTQINQRAATFAGPHPQNALRETQAEIENLLQAWQWASARPLFDWLLPAVSGMGSYWSYAGLYSEGEAHLRHTIEQVQQGAAATNTAQHHHLQAALALEQATMLYELSKLEQLYTAAQTAITLSQQVNDPLIEAGARLRLGQYHWRLGQYEDAADELTTAEQLAQQHGLLNLEGIICRSQAANVWRQGNLPAAQHFGERSVSLHQQSGDTRNLLRSQYFLAILAQNRQQLSVARAYLEPMLSTAHELGDRQLEMGAISLLGQITNYESKFEEALTYYELEGQLAEELGMPWQIGSNLSNRGDLWLKLGQFDRAAAFYERALALFRQLGSGLAQANVLAYMGLLSFWQGAFTNGRTHCEEALKIAQQENARREQAFARLFLAHNLYGLKQWSAAKSAYELACEAWLQIDDLSRHMEAQAGCARVYLKMGDIPAAVAAIDPIRTFLASTALDGANDPIWVYVTCYKVLQAAAAPEAQQYAEDGRRYLTGRANQIHDPTLRQQFLVAIPSHKAIFSP